MLVLKPSIFFASVFKMRARLRSVVVLVSRHVVVRFECSCVSVGCVLFFFSTFTLSFHDSLVLYSFFIFCTITFCVNKYLLFFSLLYIIYECVRVFSLVIKLHKLLFY